MHLRLYRLEEIRPLLNALQLALYLVSFFLHFFQLLVQVHDLALGDRLRRSAPFVYFGVFAGYFQRQIDRRLNSKPHYYLARGGDKHFYVQSN